VGKHDQKRSQQHDARCLEHVSFYLACG
jgi:hypothetical protein